MIIRIMVYSHICIFGSTVCVDRALLYQTTFRRWRHTIMSNEIQLSKYHDADIIGINFSDLEKGLELSFKLVNGVESTILFPGCQFYRIDGMWKQNVVYRIRNTLKESINHDEIKKYYIAWFEMIVKCPVYLSVRLIFG